MRCHSFKESPGTEYRFCHIVDDSIVSPNRRNSMPRPSSSCKHRHSCSPSVNKSHTIDNFYTKMSKVAQEQETLRTVASSYNVHDAALHAHRASRKIKMSVSVQNLAELQESPPKEGRRCSTNIQSLWRSVDPMTTPSPRTATNLPGFSKPLWCTQPHDHQTATSKVLFVEQIKRLVLAQPISWYITYLPLINNKFSPQTTRVKSINSTINNCYTIKAKA